MVQSPRALTGRIMNMAVVLTLLVCSTLGARTPASTSQPSATQPAIDGLRSIAPAVYASMERLCRGKDSLSKDELTTVANSNPFKGLTFRTKASVGVSGDKNHLNIGWGDYVHWDFGQITIDWIIQHRDKAASEADARKYVEMSKTHNFFVTWKVTDSKGSAYFEDWYKPGQKRYSFAVKCDVLKIETVKKDKADAPATQKGPDELMTLAPQVYANIQKICQGRETLTVEELDKIANGNLFNGLVLTTPAEFDVTVGKDDRARWVHYVKWQFEKINIEWILRNATKVSDAEAAKYLELAKDHRFTVTWKVVGKPGKQTYFEGWYPGQKTYSFTIYCDATDIETK